jgi:glutamine cyclotransferase
MRILDHGRGAIAILAAGLIGAGCGRSRGADSPTTNTATFDVVARWPHDPQAFTQGLVFYAGRFYESTGLNDSSSVREVEPRTGRVLRQVRLASQHFGEGLALAGDRLVQLTWKSHIAFVYRRSTLETVDTFRYQGEGWGLAFDGRRFIRSDGTNRLRLHDPVTFAEVGSVDVQDQGVPVQGLNELEIVRGELWANVYPSDWIVRIDPSTGAVRGWIDARTLYPPDQRPPTADVLNGIAYDSASDRIFVTGKRWPVVFEVRLRQ